MVQMPTGHFLSPGVSARAWLYHWMRPILALRRLTVKGRETEKAEVTMGSPGKNRDQGLGPGCPGLASGGHWDCLGKAQQRVIGTNWIDPRATWVAGPAH